MVYDEIAWDISYDIICKIMLKTQSQVWHDFWQLTAF